MLLERLVREIRKSHEFVLVDVGARGGTKQPWNEFEQFLTIVGFEPEKSEYMRLTSSEGRQRIYLDKVLWNENRKISFNVTAGPGKSSILEPNFEVINKFSEPNRFLVVDRFETEASKLDDALAGREIKADFLKLDCQGADYHILLGAKESLSRSVVGVEVEVLFEEIYRNTPRFSEIDEYMRGLGFHLYDLRPAFWKRNGANDLGYSKGKLIFADALYLREEDWGGIQSPEKLLKVVFCHALYGYYDSSYSILEALGPKYLERKLFELFREEHTKVRRILIAERIPARRRLARWAALIAKLLSKPGEAAANIGTTLGNRLE